MLAAVSRDDSMLSGGIGSGRWTGRGTVMVEPLAQLTADGEWKSLPCDSSRPETCRKFARGYLNKRHTYTVISADGHGATINAAPTALSECYDYGGPGTYSGAAIVTSAIAANSVDFFGDGPPLQRIGQEEAASIRTALAKLVPKRLDSTEKLKFFALRLEGQNMIVVQRAFRDGTSAAFIFAIGTLGQGRFHILRWKQNTEDEKERVLATIHLKSGRDFLITVVNDPESHLFRVYGLRNGRLVMVYSGGGSSC